LSTGDDAPGEAVKISDVDTFAGQIDLIRRKAYYYDPAEIATTLREEEVPEEHRDAMELARHEMIEKAAEFDEAMMEKYIHNDLENISEQEIREAGAKAEVIEDYPGTSIRPADYCRASPALDGPAFSSIVCGVGHDEDRHDL